MYRLICAVCTLSAIAIILVLTAGPSTTAEARFIRWDCSDWQPYPAVADADNELASSILETLAANRGKTLYCALDQSDTWTKRQVYDNAHRHNDRDRTQYDGSQGQGRFRGFTAGQEGWLTDGEAGITGVSPERIFEFPEQERGRRKTKILRKKVSSEPADTGNCPGNGNPGSGFTERVTTRGDLLCTNYGGRGDSSWGSEDAARNTARNRYVGLGEGAGANNFEFHWRTRRITGNGWNYNTRGNYAGGASRSEDQWIAAAETRVIAACAALGGGYKYVKGSADFGQGHSREPGAGFNNLEDKGDFHGWFFAYQTNVVGGTTYYMGKARESRTWSGVCFKKVRGSRRR